MARKGESRPATPSGHRCSASGEAARAAELQRIRAMSPLERMELALALGRRRRALEELRSEQPRGNG